MASGWDGGGAGEWEALQSLMLLLTMLSNDMQGGEEGRQLREEQAGHHSRSVMAERGGLGWGLKLYYQAGTERERGSEES